MPTEDELFEAWTKFSGDERADIEKQLFEEVVQHTTKVAAKMRIFQANLPMEAASAVMEGLPGFKDGSKFSTWSERIIRNHICDYIRELQFQRRKARDIVDHPEPEAKTEREDDLIARIDMDLASREFTPDQMKVLSMHLEGYKDYEIAEFLYLPTDNVESKLRAIREIAKNLSSGSGK